MPKPILQRFFELLSHLPLRALYRLGDLFAFIVRNTPNQVSRQTRENIALCFSNLDARERRHLYRESIRHTCYTMTELAAVWCWPTESILERVTSVDICDEFEHCERARIVIAPHLGSWETLAIWLGNNCEAIMMYKRRKNRALDAFIREARARSGGNPLPIKKRGLRKLLIGMKRGASLMILPDQKPGGNKTYIESSFFGHSAPTTSLVHNLCTKVDCELFIATMSRAAPRGEFSLNIRPLERARLSADEIGSAQYMNDQIESLARQNPAQYQWGYRRFDSSAYASKHKRH